MSKKSSPTEKAARMLDLVPYISTHQGISTSELASEFAISIPELLSDLNALWFCGDSRFDLIDLEFKSGFVSIRNAQTLNQVRNLSQQEIVSILLGLDLISKDLPANRGDLQEDIEALRKKLGKGSERLIDATPSSSSSIHLSLKEALSTRRKIEIAYTSSVSETLSTRIVNPLDLYTNQERDFLVGFCELSESQRTFRIDRISSVEVLDLEASQTHQSAPEIEMAKAMISISRDVRRSRESLGQFLSGDGTEVEVSAYSFSWLARTIISSGGAMKVLRPIELRSEVADLAAKTLGLYR
jgi:predicted DNA-binding transcriptional regulator YafY